ncbi:hypothetical protein Tco_1227750 [Tanacetum coccineum]
MSRSTISYESLAESLAESVGSLVASAIVPDHAPVAFNSEPFEAPASPVASDSESVEPYFNSEPFSGHDIPVRSAASDPNDEPLGSPDPTDYYGWSEFSKDDPSEDDYVDASSGTNESLPAHATPAISLASPPTLSPPIAPCRQRGTVQGPRKIVRPRPPLPSHILTWTNAWIAAYPSSPPSSPARLGPSHNRPRSSPSSSSGPPPKRCGVSLTPALPAHALHYVPIELLPPQNRFIASERIEALERERQGMTPNAIEELIAQHVAGALEPYETNRNTRNGNGNGSGSQSNGKSGSRRIVHIAQGCSYKELLNYQPLNFKGTKGAVGLARWFEKKEYVFNISNYAMECQVKYAACTLLNGSLTCWNSYVRTLGIDAANEMS